MIKNYTFVRMGAALIVAYILPYVDADAASPKATCPDGWYAVDEPETMIATTCPSSGYIDMGTAETCEVTNPNSDCYIFAPAGMSFDDSAGTYSYSEDCDDLEESSSSSS